MILFLYGMSKKNRENRPDSASRLNGKGSMQQSLETYPSQTISSEQVLPIPRTVYNALNFYDKLVAQALERVGKVRIVD